jgi:hypothetical protein
LLENAIDVSNMINYIVIPYMDNDMNFAMLEGVPSGDDIL